MAADPEAAAKRIALMTMTSTVPVGPPMLAKGRKGVPRNLNTNSFPIKLKPNIPFYLHDIRINAVYNNEKGEEKLRECTKQTRDDFTEQDRKRSSMIAYLAMQRIGVLKGSFMYDRAALLISLTEICKNGSELTVTLTKQNAPELFKMDSIMEASEVRVVIKKAADTYQVNSNDINSKDEATLKALQNVTNIATSQHLFEQFDRFVVYGNGNAYQLDGQSFDAGTRDKEGGVGLTKGVRFVEGSTPGSSAFAITIDSKKTAFHKDHQLVSEKLEDCGAARDLSEANRVLVGERVYVDYAGVKKGHPKYGKSKKYFTIGSVSTRRVRDINVRAKDGKTQTLQQFILKTYDTQIRNVDAYVIVDKHNDNCMYSPETLRIAPNQRVKSENTQPVTTERLIRASASLPAVRQAETAALARTLNAGADNAAQVARGITADLSKPISVEGRKLPPVLLGTGGGIMAADGSFRQGKLAQVPLPIFNRWTVVHIFSGNEQDLSKETAAALARYALAINFDMRQMTLNTVHKSYNSDHEAQMRAIFEKEKADGSKFIMVICHKNIKNHELIKTLEVEYDVVTQQLTSMVAQKLAQQSNTGTNVVLKVTEKLGGQNHYISKTTVDLPLWVTAKGTMIVGLQMQHPSAMTGKEKESNVAPSRPVFIGWGINAVRGAVTRGMSDAQQEKEATHFSSGWTYAHPKDYKEGADFFESYKNVALSCLRTYKKYRDTIPARIILIRGGVAEGDYAKIRSEEVHIWQAAFTTLSPKYIPSFIIFTSNEMHSDRFFPEKINPADKAPKQNLPAGMVIDSGVTNPQQPQAYCQSHTALQGTVKTPLIAPQHAFLNPLHNLKLDMDDIIRINNALCYSHGVCNSPTAVATPLYVARESMKRASELFIYHLRRSQTRSWNLDQLKKELTLNPDTSDIHGLRVNA